MLFETYGMIVPEPNTCKNYELFYQFYSLNIKQNLIINRLLKESNSQLPIMNLEIKESINHKLQEVDTHLLVMGVKRESTEREEYNISILSNDFYIKNKYFENSDEEFINYITDVQQIILLYSSFENTIKSQLITQGRNENDRFFQKRLLSDICIAYPNFVDKFGQLYKEFTADDFNTIWKYFSSIRNLYSHSSGVIDSDFIKDMYKIQNKVILMIERNFDLIEQSLVKNEEILRIQDFTKDDLFIISEIELRFFRNFIIYTWETLYLLSHSLTKKKDGKHNIKFDLINNELKFRQAEKYEESAVLQTMPTFMTEKISNFYISTYMCPNCIEKHIFLYKTLYHPNISLKEISNKEEHKDIKIERAFTCPNCQSFFISKYKEKLSDNNGVNITVNIVEYDDYLFILEQFNIKSSAYTPQLLKDMEDVDSSKQIFEFEKMVKEMRENRNRLNNSK